MAVGLTRSERLGRSVDYAGNKCAGQQAWHTEIASLVHAQVGRMRSLLRSVRLRTLSKASITICQQNCLTNFLRANSAGQEPHF